MQLPDPTQFVFRDCIVAGDECILITPNDMGTTWNDDNARFRSCIVRKSDNFVVSQGFAKFCNFAEKPDFQPWNHDWTIEARHKLDGSLLIVSKYKGQLICRTRGTVDARQLDNGHEIDLLIAKYPKAFDNNWLDAEGYSLLFEWTTPNNVIVLREHAEPTLTLLGIVHHWSCGYFAQKDVDAFAQEIGVNRPVRYHYNSIMEVIEDVDAWKGAEGVVLYSPDGQTLKKIKAAEYLVAHRAKSSLSSRNNLIDYFFENGCDLSNIDWEILVLVEDSLREVGLEYQELSSKIKKVEDKLSTIEFDSRKEFALHLIKFYPQYQAYFFANNASAKQKVLKKMLKG